MGEAGILQKRAPPRTRIPYGLRVRGELAVTICELPRLLINEPTTFLGWWGHVEQTRHAAVAMPGNRRFRSPRGTAGGTSVGAMSSPRH